MGHTVSYESYWSCTGHAPMGKIDPLQILRPNHIKPPEKEGPAPLTLSAQKPKKPHCKCSSPENQSVSHKGYRSLDDHQRDVRFQVTKKMQETVPQKFNATLMGFVTTRQLATFDPHIISHSHDSPTIHRYNGFLSRIHSRQQYMAATAIVRRVQDPSGPPEEMRSMGLQWVAVGCNLNRLVKKPKMPMCINDHQ